MKTESYMKFDILSKPAEDKYKKFLSHLNELALSVIRLN